MGTSGDYKTIVWFRRDLRIEDNPALSAAARDGSVLAVFIWCPKEEQQFYPGRVSRWWLKQSLIQLGHSLKTLGADLVLMKAQSTMSALIECISATGANKVVFNQLYDPVSLVRDHVIKQKLGELGVPVQTYNADLLYEPWEVYNDEGYAFTTFDAYWDTCLKMQKDPIMRLPPRKLVQARGSVEDCTIEELGLEDDSEKSSNALLGRAWTPGWIHAEKALTNFIENHLLDYANDRQKVTDSSTSILSPYIHFGEISIRKVYHSVIMKQILWAKQPNHPGETSVTCFLKSIGLREYSRYICFNFPFTHEKSLLSNLKYFPWEGNQSHFKSWRQGRTGYPLVDAGMRELWATGWLHNKIRVITASFLVKCLLLPWQWGMKYFWDTLLDADLECDILGWQYISGSLPDGHELHRLDSPEVQGFKFDPKGEYVRQWLPELSRVPTEWIHHPWNAPLSVLQAAGVELGLNYPKPIIDIEIARDRLTSAILQMKEKESASKQDNGEGTNEVVVDNCGPENPPIPKVFLRKEKKPCPSSSSNDQKVPSMHKDVTVPNNNNYNNDRKRSKGLELEEGQEPDEYNLHDCKTGSGYLETDDDLCSTAVSSSASKKLKQAAGTSNFGSSSFPIKENC
ncbi:putative deoxyribodipyrimidine photo-lyase [Helianthus annuus]|uniref:Deoxyribodipyrimidine photo-lyase n=1 Tax=Helianthus annuus TaxID=4232 RepID=A0A251VCC4_HELAN|nr:cryptochrome-1 [Helianthus annuus]XP_035843672.1 cryptochrome-1 [Helianthus annuus]KAF5816543.1 putative deoxyribodipyrimidine photo-lyase [Helianthus annuus]